MVETAIATVAIATFLTLWRRALGAARHVWHAATLWERVCIVLAFMPIPGPLDEILGAVVIARVSRRMAR